MPIQIPELTEHSMVTWVSGFYKMMGESTCTILQYTASQIACPSTVLVPKQNTRTESAAVLVYLASAVAELLKSMMHS